MGYFTTDSQSLTTEDFYLNEPEPSWFVWYFEFLEVRLLLVM